MRKQFKCGQITLAKWTAVLIAKGYLKLRKDGKHLYYFPFETHEIASDRTRREVRSIVKKARIVPAAQVHTVPTVRVRTVPACGYRTKEMNITKELTAAAPLSGAKSADGIERLIQNLRASVDQP